MHNLSRGLSAKDFDSSKVVWRYGATGYIFLHVILGTKVIKIRPLVPD